MSVSSSLKFWWNSCMSPSSPGIFELGSIFINVSVSLLVIYVYKLFISPWFNFGTLYTYGNFPISVRFSNVTEHSVLKCPYDFLDSIGICCNSHYFCSALWAFLSSSFHCAHTLLYTLSSTPVILEISLLISFTLS